METVSADYGKRVYQGVRVKHTVKDLLAEKRLRQTGGSRLNGSVATTQSSFVTLPGSAAVSSYYGVRRSLMADMDLQSNKQISGDVYASSLIAKPFAYDSPAVQGYPSILDTHFMDQYVDHRAASVTSGASSLLGASPLTSIMPSFPSDAAHFLTRDSWEPPLPDSLGQSDECSESLQGSSAPGCLTSHEPGGSSHYRSPSWSSPLPGTPSYPFHALEDVHYAAGYSSSSSSSSYPFSSFMTTVGSDLPPKMFHASSEESSDATPLPDNSALWPKEDSSPLWGLYECRRTY
ncbi:POU domain class 2-associating factor 2 [Elgaria multicarinata webbii]|uniref:POU domain class 2-associating factor 2 n=1 Tax=Elgaria multicarinata webbii TaxID=159646 RepID=UPI002FCCCD70